MYLAKISLWLFDFNVLKKTLNIRNPYLMFTDYERKMNVS